ncbi:hypothetical protein LJR071_003221 [Pseudomonas sp. LjRoot71]|uniref:hypothetical protein n=1 Tax=Pseudomonas sp. LjRoot71 TaxID=3342336 RepID=UPI003ECFA683
MEDLTYKGEELEFWGVTGEVLSSSKNKETQVYSTGGGLVGSDGHVTQPQVHSTTITNHEFWIKRENGVEEPIRLRGVDIPLRAGQKITIISARKKSSGIGCMSILVNHTASKHWYINDAKELSKYLEAFRTTGKTFLIALIAWFGIFFLGDWLGDGSEAFTLAGWVFAGIVLYRVPVGLWRRFQFNKLLALHLESLAKRAYQNS